MLTTFVLATLPILASPTGASDPTAFALVDDEYDKRRKEAGDDVEKLWALYEWCDAYGKKSEARRTLIRIVKLEPNHRPAHEALGHVEYDGQWFTSEKKLEAYKKEKEEREAKEKGLVKYEGEWVPAEHVPYLERGLVRDEEGRWLSAEDYERIQEGWTRQDLVWVAPDEKDKVAQGLWKCGDDWKTLEQANAYHSELGKWWVIPSEHYVAYSTCDREIAKQALECMEDAFNDFVRAFGRAPDRPLNVVVLRDVPQYQAFANGGEGWPQLTDSRANSSIHYAYFADVFFGDEGFMGAGVAYWDASDPNGAAYGNHAARHAAGQAFVEAFDPSTKAVAEVVEKGGEPSEAFVTSFWEEKALPLWLRFGIATYGERYYVDPHVESGGNPYWTREWSVQNIQNRGGMRPLERIFAFELSPDEASRQDAQKLINESGLLVAFVLDGECAPVTERYQALKVALEKGKGVDKAVSALEKEIARHEKELRAFAKL